ncbi:MAG: Ca-activated chloride channel [Verrucomicrobiota bacterium]|jgi:Ca-activated chloride channel family protein
MNFGAPGWLWGLLALPMLVVIFVLAERRSARRLRDFVAPRLLPQLAGEVDHFRRAIRFALQLLAVALALVSLAHPRWGYTFEDVKRKGIDLLIAVDTSRSMLSNDVQPNRLERVKLATQDLIMQLQGDRVGLIAFAGRAFIQAPLTIDYDAVVEAINDLDTKTIPEGGTNISEAISLAQRTYGKSAVGNRALVIFTDGEELSGDAAKAAKAAADAGIRIFTVGVGTSQGSLIPLSSQEGGTAFVKDAKGQVVKSKLDEKRLHEVAESTGGSYLHLENGPRTMQQLFAEGLARLNAGEIDARLSRRPIERYEWPLGAAVVALALSIFISERKRGRRRIGAPSRIKPATAGAAALILLLSPFASASTPGLNLYEDGKFAEAYETFEQDLKKHPDSEARDKMQFDAGAAAYKMRDYNKAAEAFSQALLTNDKRLQGSSHFNMGRTLEERADMSKTDDDALKDLTNAQTHYEDVLKLDPDNEAAKANLEEVKKKIARLKDRRKPKPTPTPTPPPPQKKDDKKDQGGGGGGGKDKNDQKDQKQQSQDQQKQSDSEENQKEIDKQQQPQSKSESQKDQQAKNQNQSPSPQPGQPTPTPPPSPGPGETEKNEKPPQDNPPEPSPTAGEGENASPTPSPGEGEGAGESPTPSAAPTEPPKKKLAGEVKGAADDKPPQPNQTPEFANTEPEKEGEMSERQAEALLESMKDEEARVQLDERRAARHVYNDW